MQCHDLCCIQKIMNRRDSDVTSGCSSGGSSQADSGRGPSVGFDDQFTSYTTTPHSFPPSVFEEHFQAWQRSARSNHNNLMSNRNMTKATPAIFRSTDGFTFDSKSRTQLEDVNSLRQVSMVAMRDFNEKSRRISLESDLNSECESSTSGSFTFDCNTYRSIHI